MTSSPDPTAGTAATDPFTGLPADLVAEYDELQAAAMETDPEEGACG